MAAEMKPMVPSGPDQSAKASDPTPMDGARADARLKQCKLQWTAADTDAEGVLSGNKIKNVSFLQLTAYDPRSEAINSAAAPILLQQTLAAQSSQIDGVSGATYTSEGYVQSLQSALDQAGIR